MTRAKGELSVAKLEKKLAIIGGISIAITTVLFFIDSDPGYPGFTGFLRTAFELLLMTGLVFIILSINFFAISFFINRIGGLFRTKKP